MDRRDFLKSVANSAVVLSLAGVVGWKLDLNDSKENHDLIEREFFAMGTRGKIFASIDNRQVTTTALDAAINRIDYLENKLSKFSPYTDIGRLNKNPNSSQYVSIDTVKVLKTGLALTPLTLHRFDMGMGNFLAYEGLDNSVPIVGKHQLTEKVLAHNRLLDINDRQVRLLRPDTMLDLGGIAKGYALDEGLKVLKSFNIKHAAIDLGGDLIVYGGKSPNEPWTIGIDKRAHVSDSNKKYKLMSGAIASSGIYYKPGHIIDPKSLKPSHRYVLTTVIGPRATHCDALATAAFNTDPEQLSALKSNFPNYQIFTQA